MTVAKVLRMYMMTYSLFKIERLNTHIKLKLYKALISSVMNYARLTREYAAADHLLKPQLLQNKVLGTIGNLDRCTLPLFARGFKVPYITKLCRTQTEVILNHANLNVLGTG
jgi:hypothetical protein